ncbi:hypothetical protein SAMN05216358_0081 [Rhizobium sp. AN5]|uniref:hypothetical protein n=1 Tax=Rhizobium sp. AN5 TaxID=1855304 RepID=UPI000BD1F410|nr:hypothetical protein [Rhizobium sp. AN5]SOC90062.1 hypothetical protein SAMN05216358_0081 [Rhizobium sp. AN5]
MTHMEFYQHTEGLRQAITGAITVYLARNDIPFSQEAFVEQSSTEIEELSKGALFYGAEVFPDAPAAS